VSRATGPLRVHVADLLRSPGSRRHVSLQARLGELAVMTSCTPEDATTDLELDLDALPDGVTVSGTVSVAWVGACRRCLREVTGRIEASVREVFERHPTEGETWPLEGDQIDMEPLARESVLLELPVVPLCRDDCKGLCPECGVDRNEVECGHTAEGGDPRWAALDTLRFD
jgi:uncharacterized protein